MQVSMLVFSYLQRDVAKTNLLGALRLSARLSVSAQNSSSSAKWIIMKFGGGEFYLLLSKRPRFV